MITLSNPPTKESFPALFEKGCVAALGNFDGVHRGHQSLIRTAVREAEREGLFSCVYTFRTHPVSFLGRTPTLITNNDEKEEFYKRSAWIFSSPTIFRRFGICPVPNFAKKF